MYNLYVAGNPVRSLDVAEWAAGYTRWLAHLGYNPQSAHPWSLSDLQQVMARLDTRINTTTGVPLLRLLRDAFTMTILWETCSRGATAVSWCLDDLWLASGMSPPTVSATPPVPPLGLCQVLSSLSLYAPFFYMLTFCQLVQGRLLVPACTPPCRFLSAGLSYSRPLKSSTTCTLR
jgi:hypothetical protein